GGGDDDNSGSGSGGGDDDNSGSGSGGGDDDNSGSGSDDSERQSKISASGITGGIPLGGSSTTTSSQSGLGDIITAFSYNLIDHAPTGIGFDITTRLKIPTASASRNLGTGQVDFAIQGDLYKTISRFTLSATFGYRVLGNPAGVTFHNVLYGAAGIGYQLSSRTSIGTSYNMGQSPVKLQDSRDISIYVSQRVSDNFRLNIYGLRGLSERSPDWGGGLNLRYVF
ncbi:MAG TPA: transporter, partial [Nitrosomonas sp.]|nr:transporter [Nitrosomonas sp.]